MYFSTVSSLRCSTTSLKRVVQPLFGNSSDIHPGSGWNQQLPPFINTHPFSCLYTSISVSVKSMTEKALWTVFQSLLSLMEDTLAHRPYWGEERGMKTLHPSLQFYWSGDLCTTSQSHLGLAFLIPSSVLYHLVYRYTHRLFHPCPYSPWLYSSVLSVTVT